MFNATVFCFAHSKKKKLKINESNRFSRWSNAAEATNLFLRENGIEVLKAMQPQLQKKLSVEFAGIANQLLTHVPREAFLID